MKEQKITLSIDEGGVFFANETSVNFNPTQFTLDFKCITPRIDPRSREAPVLNIKHNLVILDVFHAKQFVGMLSDVIKKYEKDFGKITKPDAVKKYEEKRKTHFKKEDNRKETIPSYFG